jgi:hypothetical protein
MTRRYRAPTRSRHGRGSPPCSTASRTTASGPWAVVVEDASRFARDLVAQELGILLLVKRGVRLLTVNGDDLCDTSDPSRVMMRQIAGAFAQYEKARLVARLRRARELKGKMGGRKSLMETRPEVVELARKLRRTRSGKQRSLREISAELAARGFVAERTGRPYEAAQVSRILKKVRTAGRHSRGRGHSPRAVLRAARASRPTRPRISLRGVRVRGGVSLR